MRKLHLKIISFLCALCLWLFVVLEKQYQITFNLPIQTFNLPQNIAFATPLPDSILCEVSLPGFIKLFASDKIGEISVDLSKSPLGTQQLDLKAKHFQSPSQSITFLRYKQAPHLKFTLDTRIQKTVPIFSKVKTHLAEKRIFKETPHFAKDSITIYGARQNLKSITQVSTEELHFQNIEQDTVLSIPLQKENSFSLVSPSIEMLLKIDTLVSRTFSQVSVRLIPPKSNQTHFLEPAQTTITISGGAQVIRKMSKSDIQIFIDKNRFEIENKLSLSPVLKFSSPVHSYQLNPKEFQLIPREAPHDNIRN